MTAHPCPFPRAAERLAKGALANHLYVRRVSGPGDEWAVRDIWFSAIEITSPHTVGFMLVAVWSHKSSTGGLLERVEIRHEWDEVYERWESLPTLRAAQEAVVQEAKKC